MQKVILGLIFLSILSIGYSQDLEKYECDECICTESTSSNLTAGQDSYVCIHFLQINTDNTLIAQKAAYPVKVDKYTNLILYGAARLFTYNATEKNIDTCIIVQSQSEVKSYPIPYVHINSTGKYYANIYSVVITLDEGKVVDVIWDNVCEDTSLQWQIDFESVGGNSTDRFDYLCNTQEYCWTDSNITNAECQLQVYVSWVGTDAKGRRMTSAELRLSQFRQYSLADLYSEASSASTEANERRLLFEDKCFLSKEKEDYLRGNKKEC